MTRQLVNHGHVLVNGTRVDIPSYRSTVGDTVAVSEKATSNPGVQEALHGAVVRPGSRLPKDGARPAGQVVQAPSPKEVDIPVDIDQIVALYVR